MKDAVQLKRNTYRKKSNTKVQIKLSLPPIPLGNDESILCHTFCHEWKIKRLIIHGREYSLMLLYGAWFVSPSAWNVV